MTNIEPTASGTPITEIPTLIREPVDTARIKAEVAGMTSTMRAAPPVSHPDSWPPAAAVLTHDAGVDPRTAAWVVEWCRSLPTAELCATVEYDKLRAKKGDKYDSARVAADGHIETAVKALDEWSAELSAMVADSFPAGWLDEIDQPGWIDSLLSAPLPETGEPDKAEDANDNTGVAA